MSSKRKNLTSPLTAAIAAALYPTTEAAAQDPESELAIEEVIVTAQRREVSMQDLPQSVQAFTAEDIARNAFVDFNDVANALPSLTLIQDMPGRNSVKFRGASTGTGEYYTASTSAIYFDETPLTFNSQQLWPAMVDIERIEALPGPQGTLFGSSSLAGTVRVITNKPNPEAFEAEVYGEYFATHGGSGSWAANGWINIPLGDSLALRLVGHSRDEGGWIDNVRSRAFRRPASNFQAAFHNDQFVKDDWNEYKLTGGRAALLWDATEDWQFIVSMISEKNEADGNWAEDVGLRRNTIALFHDEFRDDEWWNASLQITGDLGFATLVSSTTYLDREITYEWQNMVYEQWKDSYWGSYYALYNSDYTYGWIFNDQTQDRFSQEIRLTSQSDSRFQWMVGGFYEEINDQWLFGAANPDLLDTTQWYYANYLAYYYSFYYDVDYPLTPTILSYTNRLDRTYEQLAFFGEVSYEISDNWSVTGGARWFQFKETNFDQSQFPEGLPPFGGFDTNGSYLSRSKTDDWAFKLSTQFYFTEDIMAYFLFSQGFRNGGFNSQRAASYTDNRGNQLLPLQYGPDFMDNYEVGMKSVLLDGSLQLNVTYFRMEWEDRQFNEGGAAGVPWWVGGNVNAGDTKTDGLEVGFNWNLTAALAFEGSVTVLDARADSRYRFLNGNIMRPGDPLPNAPDLGYWLAVDYTLPWRPFDGDLWARFDYSYGDTWWNSTSNAINRDTDGLIPDWNTSNLQFGLALPGDWTLTAFINNLTDERRVTTREDNRTEAAWLGVDRHTLWEYQIRPRHYGISVRKRFR